MVRGVYAPADVRTDHELRCRAVALVAPPTAVITGASALTIHGVPLLEAGDPVHVLVPPDQRFTLGRDVVVHRRRSASGESAPWGDARLATPRRAVLDLLLGRPVLEAVPLLDVVLRNGLLGPEDVDAVLAGRSDMGIVVARESAGLADGRAESRPESWTRVVLVLGGLDPEPQLVIRDEAGFVARVDLAFAAERVAVEYDGEHHGESSWLRTDRQRLDRLRRAGWVVVFVTKADLYLPQRELVARVRGALLARA